MSFVKSNSANYASVSRHVQAECINLGAAEAGEIHAPQPFSTQRSGMTFLICSARNWMDIGFGLSRF